MSFRVSILVGLVVALLTVGPFGALTCAAQAPDLILYNGKIVTLDERSSIVEALAVRQDRIVATGANDDVRARAGGGTRIIDLGGRTVIPGLVDSHIHAIRAGLNYATEVDWVGATSIPQAMERIRQAATAAKPGSWIIVGGGWTPHQFAEDRRPTLDEVLAVAPSHPVYIQLFYRAVLLTPTALAALGIAGEADLPGNAKLDKSEDGQSTGWISGNGAAITGLYGRLPRPALAASVSGTVQFMRALNRLGVTGVIDPGGYNLAPGEYEALFEVWRTGRLTVRVAYSICAPRPGSELEDLQHLTRFLPMGFTDGLLRFNGIGERVTWAMNNNDSPNESQKHEYYRVARWAAERGLTLTMHWNNDRSVHHLLDVFERVDRETQIRGLRWSIAHLHDASDSTLARMKALGVGWLMQDGLHFAAPSFLAMRGNAINRAPPIKTALRIGLPVGGGTDANRVMSYNPFVSLKWMIDGRTVGGLPTRGASELATREDALRIYTVGSAWFTFSEHERGSLAAGRLADLAVLSADYMTVPVGELDKLHSLLTVVGGKIVYGEGPFASLMREPVR